MGEQRKWFPQDEMNLLENMALLKWQQWIRILHMLVDKAVAVFERD